MDDDFFTLTDSEVHFLEDRADDKISNQRHVDNITPGLQCDGRSFVAGSDQLTAGYLGSGVLDRIINHGSILGCFTESVVQLFGSKFVTNNALVHHQEKLFYLLRQRIFKLESMQSEGRAMFLSDDGNSTCLETRKLCNTFMAYVLHFIGNCLVQSSDVSHIQNNPYTAQHTVAPVAMKKSLEALHLFLGPLSDLPSTCYLRVDTVGIISSRLPCGSHLLHLYLDMKLNLVQALIALLNRQDVDAKQPEQEDLKSSVRTVTTELLRDLTAIAAVVHDKAGRADARKSPFTCACVCEAWIILIHAMDQLSHKADTPVLQSFWSSLSSILNEILSSGDDSQSSQPDNLEMQSYASITCRDPIAFCWWLLDQVAPLYWYNRAGVYAVRKRGCVSGNWVFVTDLLRRSLKDDHDESQRRNVIKTSLSLSQHWSANTGLVLWLWDYFHRRLNDTFHIPGSSLHGLAIASSSAAHWMQQCTGNQSNSEAAGTSYTLFLNMVAVHLTKLLKSGSLQGWKQIKGRFYSKFHKRRMEELNETGLYHFISLFLTLASVADLEDVAMKLCSFLDLLDFKAVGLAKRVFIWRGLFALMLVYKERNVDIGVLAHKMAAGFAEVSAEYCDVQARDKTRQRHLWELIALYLDGTLEIFEHKNKNNLSEITLLGNGFKSLLKSCVDNELRHLLVFSQNVLGFVRSDDQAGSPGFHRRDGISEALWTRIFRHLQQLASDRQIVKTVPTHLADALAGFTLLAFTRHPHPANETQAVTFVSLLGSLGLEEDAEPSFCCRYLCHILPTSGVTAVLMSECLQARVIHTWFRCLLQLSPAQEDCQAFTRCVAKLPEMCQLISNQADLASSGNTEKSLKIFIASLGSYHSNLTKFDETIQFRERAQNYLGDVSKYIETFVSSAGPPESIKLCYFVAGYLVQQCPKIIYSKTQPHCLLPRLLDHLVVPLTSKKAMAPALQQCAKAYLHLFLQGLRCLDFRRDDFIKRKIKQIFAKYFHPISQKCQASGGVSIQHPFMVVLQDSLKANPTLDASDFRQFIVEFIRDSCLNLPQPPQNLTPTLYFLEQLMRKTESPGETARNSPSLLAPVLSCLLACNACSPANEPRNIRKQASELLRMMLQSCKATSETTETRQLLLGPSLKMFLYSNIEQYKGLVFKTCEAVAALDPDLIASLILDMRQAVMQCEQKRGVGADSQLRSSLKTLLQMIGRAADADMD